jgi:hypothetical protein
MKFVDRGIHLVYYTHHLALFPEQQQNWLPAKKTLLNIHLHMIPIMKKVWNFGHSIVMYAGPSQLRS